MCEIITVNDPISNIIRKLRANRIHQSHIFIKLYVRSIFKIIFICGLTYQLESDQMFGTVYYMNS